MRGLFFLSVAAALSAVPAFAVNSTPEKVERLDSVVVSVSRAGKNTPVTYSMVGKDELRQANPINSLPMSLGLQPSVVTSNEGGTGLGYSKMTIRGSKGSQINVTLNGITLNDAESQEVFWVNIPALSSILSSVQVQRGLGTSSNGPGSFGASINMNTSSVSPDPYSNCQISAGSYNTMSTVISAGTGLSKHGFYMNAAYSFGKTDGYIRNAYADVKSAFLNAGWLNERNSLRFTLLFGGQHTGLTWDGIPMSTYFTDRRANNLGAYYDKFGNVKYYDNETDNYTQIHYQLNYTRKLNSSLVWSTTANYTKGDGYYEQYKQNRKFTSYGFAQPIEIDGTTYKRSDLVIRKCMDNYLLVLNSDLKYTSEALNMTGGLYLSRHDGGHFGNVIWSDVLGDDYDYTSLGNWYSNKGIKQEMNVYLRGEYSLLSWLTVWADLQYRGVSLDMYGKDDEGSSLDYKAKWNFFNPRLGATFQVADGHKAYISAALGHREPGRSDLKESIESVNAEIASGNADAQMTLRPESMVDIEAGYTYVGRRFSASANIYLMEYRNMLLETGKISDTGYSVKENVPVSWRRGVELAASYSPIEIVTLDANLTLSDNKIKNYTAYYQEIDNADNWEYLGMKAVNFGKTPMLMSPSVISMARLTLRPFASCKRNSLQTTNISLSGKYVSSQYWDNTGSADRKVPGYFVANLALGHTFDIAQGKLSLRAYVNNLLDRKYYSDVWVYRAYCRDTDKYYQEEGVFPQAGINMMLSVSYSF